MPFIFSLVLYTLLLVRQTKPHMRLASLILLLVGLGFAASAQKKVTSPLSAYSRKWDDAKYLACNTAKNSSYMSDSEKKIIYILNLARMNPKLFAETVVLTFHPDAGKNESGEPRYVSSLIAMLDTVRPLNLLKPDQDCYKSAYMHASTSGKLGYTGHERQTTAATKAQRFRGECCSYGHGSPIQIVMQLLVDQDVPSLGHRMICLGSYTTIGVSLEPHKSWSYNCVLDFR